MFFGETGSRGSHRAARACQESSLCSGNEVWPTELEAVLNTIPSKPSLLTPSHQTTGLKKGQRKPREQEGVRAPTFGSFHCLSSPQNRAPRSGGFFFHFQNAYHWRVAFGNVGQRSGLDQVRPA